MRLLLSPEQVQLLTEELVEHPPERLVHVVARQIGATTFTVTALVLDDDAETSPGHCRASSSGEEALQAIERATGGQYLGIVHSHPAHHPEPSAQDGRAAWDLLNLNERLDLALVGVVTSTCPEGLPDHGLALGRGQLSLHVAERTGDPGTLQPASAAASTDAAAFLDALHQRVPAAALAAVCARRVAVFGVGSLGSTIAEQLTRNGVGSLHLVDPDEVEAVNLSRSVYTTADVGRAKVDALADRLRAINPLAEVTVSRARLGDDTLQQLSETAAWADLVIAVTDDPRAQGMLDHLVHAHDTVGLFAGVLPGGHAGELVLVLPGVTTCYRCAAGRHREQAASSPSTDYATGRLAGLSALGADIATIATLAARTALGLLELQHGTDTALLPALVQGRTMVQVGLSPAAFAGYGAFDSTPNQHQFQSLWMHPEPAEDCPNCPGPQPAQAATLTQVPDDTAVEASPLIPKPATAGAVETTLATPAPQEA